MLAGELLFGGAVLIAHQKFFRGGKLDRSGERQPVFVLERALETLVIEPQCRIGDARLRRDPAHDVLGIGHARHCLRVDERDDLDVIEAGLRQGVDQRDLSCGRDCSLLELEALARAFFDDVHRCRQIAHGRPFRSARRLAGNDVARLQGLDLGTGKSELGQDFGCVLADAGRLAAQRKIMIADFHGQAWNFPM